MITAWILIILGSNGGGSINTIELNTEQACVVAKQKIEEYRGGANTRYSGICTPKWVK